MGKGKGGSNTTGGNPNHAQPEVRYPFSKMIMTVFGFVLAIKTFFIHEKMYMVNEWYKNRPLLLKNHRLHTHKCCFMNLFNIHALFFHIKDFKRVIYFNLVIFMSRKEGKKKRD